MKRSLILKHVSAFSLVVLFLAVPYIVFGQWDTGKTNAQEGGTPTGSIYDIISSTMKWLLAILGFIAIIGFVISGIFYLTAAGNEDQIKKAKSAMVNSIFGVIVALLGYVIVQAVDKWLGGSDTQF